MEVDNINTIFEVGDSHCKIAVDCVTVSWNPSVCLPNPRNVMLFTKVISNVCSG